MLKAVLGREPLVVRHDRPGETGYRSYEVHQRQRVGESTEKIKATDLVSADFVRDPWPVFTILREDYPCYRTWLTNDYWISRYDDVTSIFVDDANFETRPKRWFYGRPDLGRDLTEELPVLEARARIWDESIEAVTDALLDELAASGEPDVATGFAARLPLELLARVVGVPEAERGAFVENWWRMQLGVGWEPQAREAGAQAMAELEARCGEWLAARRGDESDDLIGTLANGEFDGRPVTGGDLVATLLEMDHETLHGGLANLLCLLLTHREQLEIVRRDARLVKIAWLEALRHSPPVLTAKRFARHEVERFGRLLPEGALLQCTASANRDPRIFADPERFDIARKDLCHREPRGQFRADGLASGIAFGLGRPSRHPAVPEDRPRSIHALTRDMAVIATNRLLERFPALELRDGFTPALRSLRLGEMRTCWQLPVALGV